MASSLATSRVSASLRLPSAPISTTHAAKSAMFGSVSGLCPCTPMTTRDSRRTQRVAAPRAEVDPDTLVGVGVGLAGIAFGIAIPVFYEMATTKSTKRENDQPCFPCKGTGALSCRFCLGKGVVVVDLGGGETESSECVNCSGKGSITCTTCQGAGVQPRYLDRREFQDDD